MANQAPAGLSPAEQAAWDAQPEVVDTKTMTPVQEESNEQPKEESKPSAEDGVHTKLRELEEENKRLRDERENYKRATLAKEAEVRTLRDRPKPRTVEPESESDEGESESKSSSTADDVIERKIRDIQGRANEQAALRDALDPSHTSHIPELVDRDQYATIIQYLPRNTDRSSPSLVLRALKSAVIAWKADTGRLTVGERPQEKNTAVSEPRGGSGKRPNEAEQIPQLPIRKPVPPSKWYT